MKCHENVVSKLQRHIKLSLWCFCPFQSQMIWTTKYCVWWSQYVDVHIKRNTALFWILSKINIKMNKVHWISWLIQILAAVNVTGLFLLQNKNLIPFTLIITFNTICSYKRNDDTKDLAENIKTEAKINEARLALIFCWVLFCVVFIFVLSFINFH